MPEDFLDELEELALGSRIKRLSERMLAQAAEVYKAFDLDFQPKWFTLMALLHHKEQVSIVEAAGLLGVSQPAISQFSRQLIKEGLVKRETCGKDSRRKLLTLTDKGQEQVATMLPMWRAVKQAAAEICTEFENDFYQSLKKCEKALSQKSLLQRSMENYNEQDNN